MSFQRVHASDAMRVTNCLGLAAGTLEAMPTQPRAHGQPRGTMHLLRTAPVPLSWTDKRGPTNVVVSCTNVGPVRHRAIDSSELRLTTDREGRQVGQHRSHIVAAVSSACLIARAAASGSQGRIVSSLSPGRPRADVGLSAVWSDLSAVSATDQVRVFLWLEGLSVCTPLEISPNLPSD